MIQKILKKWSLRFAVGGTIFDTGLAVGATTIGSTYPALHSWSEIMIYVAIAGFWICQLPLWIIDWKVKIEKIVRGAFK